MEVTSFKVSGGNRDQGERGESGRIIKDCTRMIRRVYCKTMCLYMRLVCVFWRLGRCGRSLLPVLKAKALRV